MNEINRYTHKITLKNVQSSSNSFELPPRSPIVSEAVRLILKLSVMRYIMRIYIT